MGMPLGGFLRRRKMIVTVGVNPRDKRNENCFGEIFERESKIVTKHKTKEFREICNFYFKKIDTQPIVTSLLNVNI